MAAMPMMESIASFSDDEDIDACFDEEICESKAQIDDELWDDDAIEELNKKLNERLAHKSDTYSEYLLYLIESKGMKNADVYNRAIVDKRYFSKIKNNKHFHPEKIKALCLCVGARLNLDETKDLLARAGYALSPCDLTDIIFSFYIEHKHYDVIDIDKGEASKDGRLKTLKSSQLLQKKLDLILQCFIILKPFRIVQDFVLLDMLMNI